MPSHFSTTRTNRFASPTFLILALTLALLPGACNSKSHTSDPQLSQIDALLDTQLPKGTPMTRVAFYLNSRGYAVLDSRSDTVVAIVHHIDVTTLQPSTARVTFHFDATSRLTSYELERTPEMAPHS